MKKILILFLLTPIALFSQEKLSIGGTYRYGNDINKENVGEIFVVPKSGNRAIIYISTSKQAPSYNSFFLLTEIHVASNKAFYQNETDGGTLGFEFFKDHIKTTDPNSITFSHISLNNVVFQKVSNDIPKTFPRGDGRDIELTKLVDDYSINYFSSNSIWDFIGIWQYGQRIETLNISKSLASDSILIHYNSYSDGFMDRYFSNCYFKEGKIYGDYYGGRTNVILEIEDGNLLLTIDPFHEFNPIRKQEFKKYPRSIFKYSAKKNNVYIQDGAENEDSIPPGDRVWLNNDQGDLGFNPIVLYENRFNKRHVNKQNIHIQPEQLSDIKPLFISEDVQIKFFNNFNESELFVKQLYTKEKLKENIFIETVPEQNIVGQKKLLVDQDAYDKLALSIIKGHYEEIFITGTVDLAKEFRTIVIDFQSEYEYSTYLVNYNAKGAYIDHVLIGYNDYVESYTPINAVFPSGEVIVNYMIFTSDDNETSSEKIYESKRYIINTRGQFLASNYDVSYMQKPETKLEVASQTFNTKTFGNMVLTLFINVIDTNNVGGYVTSMFIKMEADSLMDQTIPMDLSGVCGFHYPPYGDFIGPTGELQKLFSANIYDGVQEGLFIKISLKNGTEELFMEITDTSYSHPPKETYHFIKEAGSLVMQY